jgi:FkbM family methyltransferase
MAGIKRRLKAGLAGLGYDVVRVENSNSLNIHLGIILRELGVNCVIDVGGHKGEFGLLVREAGYRERIVSFEPVLSNFQQLQIASRVDPNWQCRRLALGREQGERAISVSQYSTLSSFMAPSELSQAVFGHGASQDHEETVPISTLDASFTECIEGIHSPVVFLKIDTQGWDLEVLAGAGRSLEHIDGLQLELSFMPLYEHEAPFDEAIRRLQAKRFYPTGIFPVLRHNDLTLIEADCVFRRSNK